MPTKISEFPEDVDVTPDAVLVINRGGQTRHTTVANLLQVLSAEGLDLSDLPEILANLGAAPAEHDHADEYLSLEGGDLTGDISVNGNLVVTNGLNPGTKGSTVTARLDNAPDAFPGDNISGPRLRFSDSSGHTLGPQLSGTWKARCYCTPGNAGTFERVA